MKLSFGSWAFLRGAFAENPVSLHKTLHKLEDEGYQGVELAAVSPHPTPDLHDAHKRDHLKKEVADHGLALSGLAPNLRGHTLITSDEIGLYLGAFERNLQFAADLGIGAIRIDTVEPTVQVNQVGLEPAVVLERVVAAFSECAKLAAARNVRVCWEFEPHLPLHSPDEIVALVDAVRGRNNPNFGVLFDTSHASVCSVGHELDLLRRLHGRINHVHLADSDGSVDEQGISRHLPLGEGRIDFGKLLPELRAQPPDDWWVVDLYNCPTAWDAVAASKKFLEPFLK
ncbi:MAG: sugar phosphate isomerase/epimerase family protein [Gemmataceae bacterium]